MPTLQRLVYPVLFEIPGLGFPIRSFGVLVAAGIFLAIWLWGKLLERYGDDPEQDPVRGSQVALWIVVGVLAGARLMYVTVEVGRYATTDVSADMERYLAANDRNAVVETMEFEEVEAARRVLVGYEFLHDPFRVLMIWQGGLVMYGGLIGGILLGVWSSRKHGLVVWNAFDTALVASFVGLSIGRWGCLLVGDDHGASVPDAWIDASFPIVIHVPPVEWLIENPQSLFPRELGGDVLWATQVWMSLNALMIALVGWMLLKRRKRYGTVGAWLLIYYSITRFVIENFRGDEVRGLWFGGLLSTSQLVSFFGLAAGIALLAWKPGRPVQARTT